MNIDDYILDENFESKAAETLQKFENASRYLGSIEQGIASGARFLDMDYYRAYYDYIKADDDHMKTFLHFIKTCYNNAKKGGELMSFSQRKVSEFKDIERKCVTAFDKYYSYYNKLSKITQDWKVEIDKICSINLNAVPITLLKLHGYLIGVDYKHSKLANEVEKYRNEEILPILQHCEELFAPSNDEAKPPEFLN